MTTPPRKQQKPKSKSTSQPKTTPKLPGLGSEAIMRDIQKVLQGKQFKDVDEANAFLATLTGPGLQQALSELADAGEDRRGQAQELAFDAMEAEDGEQARELAQRALALDPDCVDALVIMTGLDASNEREAIAGLKKAVEAGERALGTEFFRENKGEFWGILETRPYMRARLRLAEFLRAAGNGVQAMEHYAGVLELNPDDNQGVRYPLLGCYLAHGRLREAEKLLQAYDGDIMATWAWGKVLERYLADDRSGALKALRAARRGNPYVELYFSGQTRLPEGMPDTYGLGSREEALICFDHLAAAWAKRDAIFWLLDRIVGTPAVRGKRGGAKPKDIRE